MDFTNIFKKEYIVGLDIGSSSVKMAAFRRSEGDFSLVKADLREIAEVADNTAREKEILSAVKELFKGIDIRKSKIIASINCPKTSVKVVKAPYMPKAELREGINLEAKSYFPFPLDNSWLDYEILDDIVEKGARKYEVAIAVTPKNTVESCLSLLGRAGIKPASFVPCPYALQRLAGKEERTACLIDIGELSTELIILKSGILAFSRKIPVAGRDFTKAMTGVLVSERGRTELSLAEAEKIKREVGIPEDGAEPQIINDKISTTEVLSMIRSPLEQFVSEIERCFDYYREETGGEKIDSVTLFGGGAALTGLVKFLVEHLGIEVRLGDALLGLKIEKNAVTDREKNSYRLGSAIGAALSEGRGINLLPPEIKEETKRVIKRGTIEVIATSIILVSVLVYIGMKIELGSLERRIRTAKLELASLVPQLKRAEAQEAADMVLINEPHWEDIFKELSHIIPANIHLTHMSMSENAIKMKGIVSADDGERILSDFIILLEKGIFKNVKLVKTSDLKDKGGNEFELECWVD